MSAAVPVARRPFLQSKILLRGEGPTEIDLSLSLPEPTAQSSVGIEHGVCVEIHLWGADLRGCYCSSPECVCSAEPGTERESAPLVRTEGPSEARSGDDGEAAHLTT